MTKIDIKIKLNQFLGIKLKKIKIKNYLKKHIQQPIKIFKTKFDIINK
jgi:hypothetical protein